MSFDARSLERLQALGRTLPQPLPIPKPIAKTEPKASERRHRVEIEEDPQALFRALMQVSPDGTVPPHLMARLKEAESRQKHLQQPPRPGPAPGQQPGGNSAQQQRAQQQRGQQKQTSLGKPDPRTALEHGELYTAFQQLLLEDDAD
jgi:hypothetical protein